VAGQEAQADYADQPSDHGRSLIRLLDLTTMEERLFSQALLT
jgi:hypothetical protein